MAKKKIEITEPALTPEPFIATLPPSPPPPPEPKPTLPSFFPTEKLTQKEAVKRAMDAGKDQPIEGVGYIKEEFGMVLSTQIFSTLKSQLRKASGAPALRTRTHTPTRTTPHSPYRHSTPTPSNAGELVRTLKGLIETFGPDAVREVAEALAD